MSHPNLRTTTGRAAALTLAGAALLLPTAALAQVVPALDETRVDCDAVEALDLLVTQDCATADALLDEAASAAGPVDDTVQAVAGAAAATVDDASTAVADGAAAVTDAAEPLAGPAAESVPADPAPGAVPADPAPEAVPADPGPGSADSQPPAVPSQAPTAEAAEAAEPTPAEVKAAGVDAEEVVEPAAPAADGRVEAQQGTAITPSITGTNIPSIRSQSGVTLQPYEAPMVSTPASPVPAPQVAASAVTTVTPLQEAAAQLATLTGTAMLPYASGAGAWVAAAGLGALGAGAITWRRRENAIDPVTIGR